MEVRRRLADLPASRAGWRQGQEQAPAARHDRLPDQAHRGVPDGPRRRPGLGQGEPSRRHRSAGQESPGDPAVGNGGTPAVRHPYAPRGGVLHQIGA